MGLVKDYLSENIAREKKEIQVNRRLIDSYQSETQAKKTELNELGTKAVIFQARRCSSCGRNLTLPTVHFLCKHSVALFKLAYLILPRAALCRLELVEKVLLRSQRLILVTNGRSIEASICHCMIFGR